MIKRLFDLLFAALGLAACIPLFIVIAVLIRLDSPGPVLYRSRRVGKHGKEFDMFIFRTMRVDADPHLSTAEKVTRVGRFLRNRSIDHWPMLINVLRGEMSLVGPRAEIAGRVDMEDETWGRVLSVKPGMFSLAVRTFGEQYNEMPLPARQALELLYIEKQSLLFDLGMIVTSVLTTLRKGNVKGQV